jgi:hypothetical protein
MVGAHCRHTGARAPRHRCWSSSLVEVTTRPTTH